MNTTVLEDKKENGLMLISSQRSFIMGIAILWVAWFHTDLSVKIPGLSFLWEVGYGGVDLFFLLSGVGAFFSLYKNIDASSYLKRRAIRILPAYYPFIVVWLVMMKMTGELYGTEIIGNLTMMGWWCEGRNQFNWYTNAIWLFYLLAPVFVDIIAKANKKKLAVLFLIAGGFFASVTFFHTLLLTAFSRMPVFILGIYLGSEIMSLKNGKKKSLPYFFWTMLMLTGIFVLYFCLAKLSGDMWHYGLWWYPFILIAPGLAMNLGCLADWLQKYKAGKWICKGINQIGDASFEIFLWHIGVFEFIKPRFNMNGLSWTIVLVLVVIWSVTYRKVVNKIALKYKNFL